MKCTDLLIQEHKAILRCVEVLEQMSRRIERGDDVSNEDVQTLLEHLRTFADDHHQTMEESALFPELRRTANVQEGPLRQMLFEHDQERSLVEALDDAFHTKRGAEFVLFTNRFVEIIRNHVYKEDHILFDIIERSISTEQDEKITNEFAKFPIKPSFFVDLQRLEQKYLRKVA